MTHKKASFWKRLIACFIDAILLAILSLIVEVIFPLSYVAESWFDFLLVLSYSIFMEYYLQGTVGKGMLGLEVIKTDGTPPSVWNCIYRNFSKPISMLPFGSGYLRLLAPHQSQTVHDEYGRCLVIERARGVPGKPGS